MNRTRTGIFALAVLAVMTAVALKLYAAQNSVDIMLSGEYAKMRNTRSGMTELLAKAKDAVAAAPESYQANWQYAALLYFWGEFYETESGVKKDYFTRCKEYAEKAVAINPNDAAGHYWKGIGIAMWSQYNGILRSLFNAPKVATEMDKVIALDPAYFMGTPYAIRAIIYAYSPTYGTVADAYRSLDKAFQYGPNYRVIYEQAASVYVHVKDWQKAKATVEAGLALPLDTLRPLEERSCIEHLKAYQAEVNRHI